ncbi:putative 4-hydroxy-2-oxoglutarate aldolase, mitochondrial [Neonectria ditissima]|uniref:Putative 4-hydroxy-2-oxoglutarate aldolase, mitochondrial n=1 Tax=Neonectria ditissima TaxID=78410 RepID=A0A0P7BKN2_9HYPO|nr:putative 4-hydroxy-2-oxoglutarate aldolase, mitochondrial [Neonectria ditissima]
MTISAGSKQNNAAASSSSPSTSALQDGIYVPTVAFFTPEDTVDIATTQAHATRLAHSGITGILTHGSNGEAVHLDHAERQAINRATRSALDASGKSHIPLVAGCSAQSTRETILLCNEAASSGASHAIVLPPAYYSGLLTTDLVLEHFRAVADASSIPVLIYNFPAACGGLDLDSDSILALSKHPNIVGVKLTCGNTGKLARIVAGTRGTSFRTFGGSVDLTIQTLAVGGHGIIGGTANITPRTCLQIMELWKNGRQDEARGLQEVVARGDWIAIKGGFVAVKAALQRYYGYGGQPRKPCAFLEGKEFEFQLAGFSELVETEKKLEKSGQGLLATT